MAADYVKELDEILREVNPDKPTKPVWSTEDKPVDKDFLKEIAGTSDRTSYGVGVVGSAKEGWRQHSFDNSPVGDALADLAGKQANNSKQTLTDEQIKRFVSTRLHCGDSPRKVSAQLKKMAEMVVYNHQMADAYLSDMSGMMGLGYIEPNHFMSASCQRSLEEITKLGGRVKAACVKRLKSCGSCRMCRVASGAGELDRCDLYKLPIVGNATELRRVIVAKYKTATKVKLAAIHNGEQATQNTGLLRVEAKATQIAGSISPVSIQEFNATHVANLIKSGSDLVTAFSTGQKTVGTHVATRAITSYISSLKKTGSQVDISKVDCRFLRGKLATNNPVHGVSKCQSCTYRNCMHCGLTGGTLTSFPGMEMVGSKQASKTKLATDGAAMMESYGLTTEAVQLQGEIDMKTSVRSMDIVMSSVPSTIL